MEQIDNHKEQTTVLRRIFRLGQTSTIIRESNKKSYNKLMNDQTNNNESISSTTSQTVLKKLDKPQLNNDEPIVNKVEFMVIKPKPIVNSDEPIVNKVEPIVNKVEAIVNKLESIVNNKQKSTLSDNQKSVSLFEMWNLIESVGIKRSMLDKIFTTDEATSELYHVIEKRIHYEREQEMIRRLRSHVTKINAINKTKNELIKEVNVCN